MTQTSSEDNCENLHEKFVTFQTDDAYCKETKGCKITAAQAKTDEFQERNKEEKSTTPAKSGENFFSKNGKENAVDEINKKENEDSNVAATVGGSGNTILEDKMKLVLVLRLS